MFYVVLCCVMLCVYVNYGMCVYVCMFVYVMCVGYGTCDTLGYVMYVGMARWMDV